MNLLPCKDSSPSAAAGAPSASSSPAHVAVAKCSSRALFSASTSGPIPAAGVGESSPPVTASVLDNEQSPWGEGEHVDSGAAAAAEPSSSSPPPSSSDDFAAEAAGVPQRRHAAGGPAAGGGRKKIVLVLYPDPETAAEGQPPVGFYPPKYPRDGIPRIAHYPDGIEARSGPLLLRACQCVSSSRLSSPDSHQQHQQQAKRTRSQL